MELVWKVCPNCGSKHHGHFEDCYPCFDCDTEYEYNERKEEAEIVRKNTEWMINQDQ